MSISDEIERLNKLRIQGALSEEEFVSAKRQLIGGDERRSDEHSVGRAANRYVTWYMVMGVVGLILFLIVFVTVFLPGFNRARNDGNVPSDLPDGVRREIEKIR